MNKGILKLYHKFHPMQDRKGKNTNVSITDDGYTRLTL